jgi:protein phosphatase
MKALRMSPDHEITAEMNVEDLAAPGPEEEGEARPVLSVTFAAKTDLGRVRENNEDKFDWWEPEDAALLAARGRLYAVADGMGGHAAGQIAAEMALKEIGESYFAGTRGTPEVALKRAIVKANAQGFDTARAIPSRKGMGCTVVLLAVVGADAVVAWAGDSRVYRVRNGTAEQLTEDHSWVHEQVRAGALTEEDAERSPYRNVITRCLGPEPAVTPETRREALQAGDSLLLCSDGLTGLVRDAEIAAVVAAGPPSFACRELIDRANNGGGPDNVTAAIVRIDGDAESAGGLLTPEPEPAAAAPPRKRRRFPWSAGD